MVRLTVGGGWGCGCLRYEGGSCCCKLGWRNKSWDGRETDYIRHGLGVGRESHMTGLAGRVSLLPARWRGVNRLLVAHRPSYARKTDQATPCRPPLHQHAACSRPSTSVHRREDPQHTSSCTEEARIRAGDGLSAPICRAPATCRPPLGRCNLLTSTLSGLLWPPCTDPGAPGAAMRRARPGGLGIAPRRWETVPRHTRQGGPRVDQIQCQTGP